MKKTICIILAALMLGGVVGYAASSKQPFADVPIGSWYEKAVAWAYECGVTNGVDDTHFEPNRPITRAEMVTMLWRLHGSPDVGSVPVPSGTETIYEAPPSYLGRLYIERNGFEPMSVGVYNGMGQGIVDRKDSACHYVKNDTIYIGDHYSDGFWIIASRQLGERCYLVRPSGTTEVYELRLIDRNGTNKRSDLVNCDGVSVWDLDYDLVLATCNDSEGISVTLAFWDCVEVVPPKEVTP